MVQLLENERLFIGFKVDSMLLRQLRSLDGINRQYVAEDGSAFLTLCKKGNADYVGKLLEEPLTTDRVDDVRRNVLSILQRVCPETRLPTQMEILPYVAGAAPVDATAPSTATDRS